MAGQRRSFTSSAPVRSASRSSGCCTELKGPLGIEEVTFHKRTPLLHDRSKVVNLVKRGARLCVDAGAVKGFQDLGMEPAFEAAEALDRAAVVIDCTPSGVGIANKNAFYSKYTHNTLGFIAQGSEFGFGKPYARGINDKALHRGEDQFVQVVSCNTHNLSILVQTLAMADGGPDNVVEGRFVCMRRASDLSQDDSFVASPRSASTRTRASAPITPATRGTCSTRWGTTSTCSPRRSCSTRSTCTRSSST
jgi:glyceraldehyde-3-phosphate dehydrogenase (NAD(P))